MDVMPEGVHSHVARPRAQAHDAFERAFAVVLGHEGGYTADPADPGNWTGGAPGRGECRGTNWGISAASYPYLPIRALTRAVGTFGGARLRPQGIEIVVVNHASSAVCATTAPVSWWSFTT